VEVGKRGNLKIDNMVVEVKPDPGIAGQESELEYVLQNNQYDILFLLQLGHRQGYDVLLKYESKNKQPKPYLFFGPASNEPRVSYILEWGKSLIQFQPTLTTTNQVNEVTVRGWDALKKKPINVTVKRDDLDTRPLRDKKKLKTLEEGFKEKKEIIVDRPFRNEKEAKEHAKALLKGIVGDMVTVHGSTVGTPDLRAGSRIETRGLGGTFDGTYTVTSTNHSISGGGYMTEFDAKLEEKN
jgi:phage protein D